MTDARHDLVTCIGAESVRAGGGIKGDCTLYPLSILAPPDVRTRRTSLQRSASAIRSTWKRRKCRGEFRFAASRTFDGLGTRAKHRFNAIVRSANVQTDRSICVAILLSGGQPGTYGRGAGYIRMHRSQRCWLSRRYRRAALQLAPDLPRGCIIERLRDNDHSPFPFRFGVAQVEIARVPARADLPLRQLHWPLVFPCQNPPIV
jgi:hypothetical protein